MARGEADDHRLDDSKDEMAELPQGWASVPVGSILPLAYGKALPARIRDESGQYPVFGSSGVVGSHTEALTDGNVIVVGRKGSAGSVHFSKDPCWPIDTAYFVQVPADLEPKFWYFRLSALQLDRLDQSTAIPSLSRDNYSRLVVSVPPLAEQRRIVSRIDELFSRIEAGERAIEEARAGLKRYRKAILKAAVTGTLTEDWRAANPPKETGADLLARILEARRTAWLNAEIEKLKAKGKPAPKTAAEREKLLAKYAAPHSPNLEVPFDLPESWCWLTVDHLTNEVRYGSSAKCGDQSSGVPVLRMGNLGWGTIDYGDLKYLPADHTEFPDLLLRDGDLLFNRTNSAELVGKSAVFRDIGRPCSYASYLISVRFLSAEPQFVAYYLNSGFGRNWIGQVVSQQVGQANVNGSKLKACTIPMPPLDEQAEIVSRVEEALSRADAAEATLDSQSRAARALKQSILKAAFTGRLVPQDPADEPASELLKRLKEAAA